jgi:hypothetical protein
LPCSAYLYLKHLIMHTFYHAYTIFLTAPCNLCSLLMLLILMILQTSYLFQILKKPFYLFIISLHPNTWVTRLTWPGEANQLPRFIGQSNNQSCGSHALKTFLLSPFALALNTPSTNMCIPYDIGIIWTLSFPLNILSSVVIAYFQVPLLVS